MTRRGLAVCGVEMQVGTFATDSHIPSLDSKAPADKDDIILCMCVCAFRFKPQPPIADALWASAKLEQYFLDKF